MKTVQVLLSTYNGEKYIRDLLDSVLNQEGVNIKLLIRDDGSTDSTIDIIQSYEDERISLFCGENLKPAKSFLQLLKCSDSVDYYAYCDQDDVWNRDKLFNAVQMMENIHNDKPVLYISTYDVVNEELELIFKRDMHFDVPFSLETTIMYRCPSGCTMVFNDALKKIINHSEPQNLRMHDFWTLMVAQAFDAKIITDEKSQLKYRQHRDNAVGYGTKFSIKVYRWIRSAFKGENERQKQAISFMTEYESKLSDEIKSRLLPVVNYRDSFRNRIKLMFNRNFKTNSFRINLMFRIAVLFGVF